MSESKNVFVNLPEKDKIGIVLNTALVGLNEYLEDSRFGVIFFSAEEDNFKDLTDEGKKKIFEVVNITCDNLSCGIEVKKKIFSILKFVLNILRENGYEHDEVEKRIAEIFYWTKFYFKN
jgi:hypothetical protein